MLVEWPLYKSSILNLRKKIITSNIDFPPTQHTFRNSLFQVKETYVISWALSCFLYTRSLLLQARKDFRVE